MWDIVVHVGLLKMNCRYFTYFYVCLHALRAHFGHLLKRVQPIQELYLLTANAAAGEIISPAIEAGQKQKKNAKKNVNHFCYTFDWT